MSLDSAVAAGLTDQVTRLVGDLRRAGVATGLTSVVDACAALRHVDIARQEQVRLALRCTLVKRAEDEAVFDALFAARFAARPAGDRGGSPHDLVDRIVTALATGDETELADLAQEAASNHRHHLQRAMRALRPHTLAHAALRQRRGDVPRRDEATERRDRADIEARLDRFLAALAGATLARRPPVRAEDLDITEASVAEQQRLRQAVRPLARRLAARLARRRLRPVGALDVRRTIRRSLGAGGVPLDPTFRHRHPHRADLWLLCDVSGSVAEFARFTIGLLSAIHDEVPKLRSFLFVDEVVEVTALLAARTHDVDPVRLVAGGRRSNWGAVLARFRSDHGRDLTPRSTIVLTGDARTHDHDPRPDVVADLVRRTRGVWLLDPEPQARWSSDDAAVTAYRDAGAHVLEVRTLAQLATAVEHIIADPTRN